MIKINIKTRMNLTLLAKAYWENLLPQGLDGEVFYDKDETGEVKSIYFKNELYYAELMNSIKANKNNFFNSNAASDWNNLFDALADFEKVEKVDYGILSHYSSTNENYSEREIDESIITKANLAEESFLINMKRLYYGYWVDYWGSINNVIIHVPIHPEQKSNFNLNPMLKLLSRYDKTLDELVLYRDPLRGISVVRISIK